MRQGFGLSFAFGGLLAGLVWAVTWPAKEVQSPPAPTTSVVKEKRKPPKVLLEFENIDSTEEKLAVLEELQKLDLTGLKQSLGEYPGDTFDKKFTFPLKVMISRMAELDPKAARDWLRETWPNADNMEYGLNQAWDLVSAEWAHQDPLALLEFWKDAESRQNDPYQIHDDELGELLLSGPPIGWMTFYHSLDFQMMPHEVERFVTTLRKREDFEEALETWNNPSQSAKDLWEELKHKIPYRLDPKYLQQRTNPRKNPLAQEIIQRWKKIDPSGYSNSKFSAWEQME